jgi:hypothetical protein
MILDRYQRGKKCKHQVDIICGKKIGPNRLPCFEVPRDKGGSPSNEHYKIKNVPRPYLFS